MAAKRPRTDEEFIPHKEMADMIEMLDNYPVAPSLESLQREVNELKAKLEQPVPRPKTRRVTLASVESKIDYLISLLTNGQPPM